MSIDLNDRRTGASAITTGTPVQAVNDGDRAWVQPLSTYYEGSERKDALSEPYLALRSHAGELESLGIAKIVEPKKPVPVEEPVEEPEDDEEEPEVEQGDDASDGVEAAAEQPAPRRRGRPPGRRG